MFSSIKQFFGPNLHKYGKVTPYQLPGAQAKASDDKKSSAGSRKGPQAKTGSRQTKDDARDLSSAQDDVFFPAGKEKA